MSEAVIMLLLLLGIRTKRQDFFWSVDSLRASLVATGLGSQWLRIVIAITE